VFACLFVLVRIVADPRSIVLNSQMRRIDLFCKLLGPIAISMADAISTIVAIYVVLGLSLASVGVEYLTIADVSLAPEIMSLSSMYN